jgi:flagellar protein FliO/FliZ
MNTSSALPVFWFVAIVAMIPVALLLLKRSPVGARLGAGGAAIVGSPTALGPHERIVTVEVGEGDDKRWLVLGVTPHSIHTLHVLTRAPQAPAAAATASFAGLLERFRHGGRDAQ